jgi:hypothetical protein
MNATFKGGRGTGGQVDASRAHSTLREEAERAESTKVGISHRTVEQHNQIVVKHGRPYVCAGAHRTGPRPVQLTTPPHPRRWRLGHGRHSLSAVLKPGVPAYGMRVVNHPRWPRPPRVVAVGHAHVPHHSRHSRRCRNHAFGLGKPHEERASVRSRALDGNRIQTNCPRPRGSNFGSNNCDRVIVPRLAKSAR